MSPRLRAGFFMLSMTLWGAQVFAQSDDARAAARSTATEGLHAMDEGRWADAVTLFGRAEALLHAPPHLLYYARASVKLGKLVQANEAYLKILRETLAPNAPRAFVDAQAAAAAEQPKVEQSLPHLTIVVEGEKAKEAHVSVNGAEIPTALIGISAPHDPGDLSLEAVAPGWRSQKTTLTLKEGAHEKVTLKLTIQDATAMPKPIEPTTARPAKSGLRAVGWISVVIGAGAIGVGTYFMIDNRNNRDAANALCNLPNGVCPSSQRAAIEAYDSAANTSAIVSWITYSAGAAFAGAGLIMLIASRVGSEPAAPKTGLVVHPWFGFGSAGLSGSF